MWIRKSEWERLKNRIEYLERIDYQPRIFLDDLPNHVSPWAQPKDYDVPLVDVVREICKHLGLRIIKTEARPSVLVLEKAKK